MRRAAAVVVSVAWLFTLAASTTGASQEGGGHVAEAGFDSVPSRSRVASAGPKAPAAPDERETTASPVAASGPRIQSSAVAGGNFRMLWNDPPTLDPHLAFDTTSGRVVVEVFSGLVALDANLQVVPDIAGSWDKSPDGLTYTFYLRQGVRFHNGVQVTAPDFVWSMERAADPATGSFTAGTYLGDIVGVAEYMAGAATGISGIQVLDDFTLRITIDAAKPYFLSKLTFPTAYVLHRQTVEAVGANWWATDPVGTGPFKIAQYIPGERILLQRNADYYLAPALLDTVDMNLAGGVGLAMYAADEIDILELDGPDLDQVLDPNHPLNQQLVAGPPELAVHYIGFNVTVPPFDDRKFRQALNHAVDKQLIATEVFTDTRSPAYGVLPPGLPGFNPGLLGLGHDPALAQQLLSESAYPVSSTRPSIVLTVPGTGGGVDLDIEVMVAMWLQVLGVEATITQMEWAQFLEALFNKSLQAYSVGWQADYPDPQNLLDNLFHCAGLGNYGSYCNSQVDTLLEQARVEPDVLARYALYHQAEQMVVDDAAWLPTWFPGDTYLLVKPYVKGYRQASLIIPNLRYVYFEATPVPSLSLWGLLGTGAVLAYLISLRSGRLARARARRAPHQSLPC